MKKFPCPICKGKGGYKEVILDDGSGPYYPCINCEDKGMIEVDSKRHKEMKYEKIAIKALEYFKPSKAEWSWEELLELGKKIEKITKEE